MYHGCGFRNRNRTRKLTDYKRDQNCALSTDEYCWRQTKQKYLVKKKITTHKEEEKNYETSFIYVSAVNTSLLIC